MAVVMGKLEMLKLKMLKPYSVVGKREFFKLGSFPSDGHDLFGSECYKKVA
jgi:hypothetical protein